jgi:hypothetical protein
MLLYTEKIETGTKPEKISSLVGAVLPRSQFVFLGRKSDKSLYLIALSGVPLVLTLSQSLKIEISGDCKLIFDFVEWQIVTGATDLEQLQKSIEDMVPGTRPSLVQRIINILRFQRKE